MLTLLAVVAMGFSLLQTPDATALAEALSHARAVVPEGSVLVSPDTVPQTEVARMTGGQPPELSLLQRATNQVGFTFGRDDEALVCDGPDRVCRSIGTFRGLVHVVEYRSPNPDSLIVLLHIVGFTPDAQVNQWVSPMDEWVDEVHVVRRGSVWKIEKVIGISET